MPQSNKTKRINPNELDNLSNFLHNECGMWELKNYSDEYIKYKLQNNLNLKLTAYNSGSLVFQGKIKENQALMDKIENFIDSVSSSKAQLSAILIKAPKKPIYIVYGHATEDLNELKYLLLELGYDPVITDTRKNTGGSQYMLDMVISDFGKSQFAIVFLTPDDISISMSEFNKSRGDSNKPQFKLRARQNVIFELGLLWKEIGRSNIMILEKTSLGDIEIPSDLLGITRFQYKESVKEIKDSIKASLDEVKWKKD